MKPLQYDEGHFGLQKREYLAKSNTRPKVRLLLDITLAIIKVTSGYKFQTAAYRTDFS